MTATDYLRSNLLGLVAIFIALSGTAWAASKIGPGEIKKNAIQSKHIVKKGIGPSEIAPNAVLSKHIKNGEVKGVDVFNGSLTGQDVADGSLASLDVKNEGLVARDLFTVAKPESVSTDTEDEQPSEYGCQFGGSDLGQLVITLVDPGDGPPVGSTLWYCGWDRFDGPEWIRLAEFGG